MKFCYIKDLNIPWFVGMVERSRRLPHTVSYDDTYVYLSDTPHEVGSCHQEPERTCDDRYGARLKRLIDKDYETLRGYKWPLKGGNKK